MPRSRLEILAEELAICKSHPELNRSKYVVNGYYRRNRDDGRKSYLRCFDIEGNRVYMVSLQTGETVAFDRGSVYDQEVKQIKRSGRVEYIIKEAIKNLLV